MTARPGGARPARPASPRGARRRFGLLLIAPYLVLLLLFGIGPVAFAFVSALGLSDVRGVLSPFARAIGDFRFLPALTNVAIYLAISLPLMIVGVVALSLLVDTLRRRWAAPLLLVYTLPGAITGAAAVMLWYFMLQPALSPFGPALRAMGFERGPDIFNNSFLVWIFALMAFAVGFGQWVLVVTGALKSVSEELLEAARIDGCSAWQTAVHVKLPLMRRTLLFMLILAFASGIQIFVEPQILHSVAGVGSTSWSLNQLGMTYAFLNGDFGSAAALSMLLFAVCLVVAVFVLVRGRFLDTEHEQ
ncbi:sugar ABC transporter permease [Agromyces soli]